MNTTLARVVPHDVRRPHLQGGTTSARLCLLATTLVVLQSLTWLAVRVALDGTSTAVVSSGRVGFTVVALWLLSARHTGAHLRPRPAGRRSASATS
mgnify:CR=1 FL=1